MADNLTSSLNRFRLHDQLLVHSPRPYRSTAGSSSTFLVRDPTGTSIGFRDGAGNYSYYLTGAVVSSCAQNGYLNAVSNGKQCALHACPAGLFKDFLNPGPFQRVYALALGRLWAGGGVDIEFRLPNEDASPDLHYILTLSRVRVLADGVELHRRKGGGYVVPLRDGRTRFIDFEIGPDGRPVLWLDTLQKFRLEPSRRGGDPASLEPASWWPVILRSVPILALLLLGGGALGALIGAAGIALNWKLVRSQSAVRVQVITATAVTAASVLVYFLVSATIGGL